MRRGFKTWAERVAVQQRELAGLEPFRPLPARLLAGQLHVTIARPEEIPGLDRAMIGRLAGESDSWSAVTVPTPSGVFVVHNTVHSARRQESDLMHELAHLLCEHRPGEVVKLDGIALPLRTYDKDQEDEASWLGGCLQLPRPALLWAIGEGLARDEIARHFVASAAQVEFRRRITGVDVQFNRTFARRR